MKGAVQVLAVFILLVGVPAVFAQSQEDIANDVAVEEEAGITPELLGGVPWRIDLLLEDIQLLITGNPEERVRVRISQADERVAEIQVVVKNSGRIKNVDEVKAKIEEKYRGKIREIVEDIRNEDDPERRFFLQKRAEIELSNHEKRASMRLKELIEREDMPEESKSGLKTALSVVGQTNEDGKGELVKIEDVIEKEITRGSGEARLRTIRMRAESLRTCEEGVIDRPTLVGSINEWADESSLVSDVLRKNEGLSFRVRVVGEKGGVVKDEANVIITDGRLTFLGTPESNPISINVPEKEACKVVETILTRDRSDALELGRKYLGGGVKTPEKED
jgi:hypothetical protein